MVQDRNPLKISIFAETGPNVLYYDVLYFLSCINKLKLNRHTDWRTDARTSWIIVVGRFTVKKILPKFLKTKKS